MGEFSLIHWLVVLVIVMLFFGPSKVEHLGKSLGRAIRGFKEGMNEIDADVKPVQEKKELHASSAQQSQSEVHKEKQNS